MENFKVGDMVIITEAQYSQGYDDIAVVGSIGYVTDVERHGCQIARYPDYNPHVHDDNSLFFLYGGFEHA